MAYFPNGSDGECYQEKYCFRCRNWRHRNDPSGFPGKSCPVMDLHLMWNYDAVGDKADKTKATALETLWPQDGECRLFVPGQMEMF